MEEKLNYIVIYDEINESKLIHYESIAKDILENKFFSIIFVKNKNDDDTYISNILSKNETLLEGLVSGKIDIYKNNNIKELLKNSFCIFYFLKHKNDFFTKNMNEIISLNKYILHKNI